MKIHPANCLLCSFREHDNIFHKTRQISCVSHFRKSHWQCSCKENNLTFPWKKPGKSLVMLAKQISFINEPVLTLNIVSDFAVNTWIWRSVLATKQILIQYASSSVVFTMHVVTERLVFCLLVFTHVWLVDSKTRQIDSSHHSRFARQVRESRSHRDTRQARPNGQSDPYETKCNYSIALLDFPPYIINSSNEKGFMHEKIKWFVDFTCFSREEIDPEACKMVPIYVRSSLEMVDLIKRRKVDFAFPIQADAKTALKDEPDVTVIRAFVSSGCSLIVNLKQCQEESRQQLFTSITSQWPILVAMMLLSGISGIIIWLLVRILV